MVASDLVDLLEVIQAHEKEGKTRRDLAGAPTGSVQLTSETLYEGLMGRQPG